MQSRDFCYWLQGFFELTEDQSGITEEQTQKIKNHLDMVFAHEITPDGQLKSDIMSDGSFTITSDKGITISKMPEIAINC